MRNRTAIFIFFAILFAFGARAWAQTISLPNTFTAGTVISATKINANFTVIVDKINAMQSGFHVTQSSSSATAIIANTHGYGSNVGDQNTALDIWGGNDAGNGGTVIQFFSPNGTRTGWISQNGYLAMAYANGSDRRLKDGIVDTRYSLDQLMKIKVRDFVFKSDPAKQLQTGFVAQELYEVYPEAVCKPASEDGTWGVDYGRLSPILVKSIQDQQKEIEALKQENAELKARLAAIEKKLGM
jgi:hypothetical protein